MKKKWLFRIIGLSQEIDWLDVLGFIGAWCVVYGVWQLYHPFAFITAGLLILWYIDLMAR